MGGVGGSMAAPAVEQAVRKSQMPASAILSSSSSSSPSSAMATSADVTPIQRPAWEMDDLIMVAGEPMPRVVFPGPPSFDEAKKATVELKDALDEYEQIFLLYTYICIYNIYLYYLYF